MSNRVRHGTGIAALLLVAAVSAGEPERATHWVAVGPAPLLEPLAPLVAHRRAQGLAVLVVAGGPDAWRTKTERPPDFLLIVGDDASDADAALRMPARERELYRWRAVQAKTFASDAAWADLDGDALPDFAVGRIPARAPDQVAAVVAKTIAYERRTPTVSDLRLVAWAGAPGYGGVVDAMATQMLVTTVRQHAPPWVSTWLISGDERQALCGWPPDQPARFAEAMREGSLLNAIVAHGNRQRTFSMRHEGHGVWFTAETARAHLPKDAGPTAPLVLLSCNGAEFDAPQDTLAEELLFWPGGPVATIGATTESHPLPNYFTGVGLLETLAAGGETRLGAVWLHAQRRAASARSALVESMLRDAEGRLEAEIDVAKLRRDQQLLYALLGDPALRLPLPGTLEAGVMRAGDGWTWTARRPEGATGLDVSFLPDDQPAAVPPAAPDDREGRRAQFVAANAAAGWAPVRSLRGDAPWSGPAPGPGKLRLVATGPGILAVAVLDVR